MSAPALVERRAGAAVIAEPRRAEAHEPTPEVVLARSLGISVDGPACIVKCSCGNLSCGFGPGAGKSAAAAWGNHMRAAYGLE